MPLKTAPLTKHELEFIKWTIWEPLRRNQNYRNEYAKLKFNDNFFDPGKTPKFCEDWKLSGPIDPDLSFDELYGPLPDETEKEAAKRIQSIFFESYISESDIVHDFNLLRPSFDGKYLNIHINLSKSRKQIEGELKKILDKWLSEKSKEFYDIGKEPTSRLMKDTWEDRFKVFDLVHDIERVWVYTDIALKIKKHPKSVQRLYKEAYESIYKEPLPTKSGRKKEIALETVEHICVSCEDRICERTLKPCKKAEAYIGQDETGSVKSLDDAETIIDYNSFKKWDIDKYNE